MAATNIDDLAAFFREKGDLHDVRVSDLVLSLCDGYLQFTLDDFNSNTADLPEYPGKAPGIIRFVDVRDCNLDFDVNERFLWIFEAEVRQIEGATTARTGVMLKFVPTGSLSLTCSGATIERTA